MDDDPYLYSFAVAISVIITIFSSMLETALGEHSSSKLEDMLGKEVSENKLKNLQNKLEDYLIATSFVGVLFLVATVLLFVKSYFILSLHSDTIITTGFLIMSLLLIIVLTIMKALAGNNAEKIIKMSFPILPVYYYSCFLVILILGMVERNINKMIGIEENVAQDTEDEIRSMVQDAEKEGSIEEDEREMIENIFELDKALVSDIMVPRTDIIFAENIMSIKEAVSLAVEKGFSRIPVFDDTRDNVVGVLYLRDVIKCLINPELDQDMSLESILRKPFFIPETKRVDELLEEFRNKKLHIAIVVDEYGGTSGLITVEDILEEIVGEIQDEYDPDLVSNIKEVSPNIYEISAKTPIDEINDTLESEIPEEEDAITIGGFIVSQLGKVPETNEEVHFENLVLTVTDADERRVKSVKIEVKENEKEEKVEN